MALHTPGRTVLIILSHIGIGEAPDAYLFGDRGTNTLGHLKEELNQFDLANLKKFGLGNIIYSYKSEATRESSAFYARARFRSSDKSRLAGIYEILGLEINSPFIEYTNGLPKDLLKEIKEITELEPISPTIDQNVHSLLGQQREEKRPILSYLEKHCLEVSYDSSLFSEEEIVNYCQKIHVILEKYHLTRIIATEIMVDEEQKPIDKKSVFDKYSNPPNPTLLDAFSAKKIPVIAIGDLGALLNNQGISKSIATIDNEDAFFRISNEFSGDSKADSQKFIVATIDDFIDLSSEHISEKRAKLLYRFDRELLRLLRILDEKDSLIIISSNGFDYTLKKEPTREYVPIFYYSRSLPPDNLANLGVRSTVSDLAETISEAYNLDKNFGAVSFWQQVIKNDVQSVKKDVLGEILKKSS